MSSFGQAVPIWRISSVTTNQVYRSVALNVSLQLNCLRKSVKYWFKIFSLFFNVRRRGPCARQCTPPRPVPYNWIPQLSHLLWGPLLEGGRGESININQKYEFEIHLMVSLAMLSYVRAFCFRIKSRFGGSYSIWAIFRSWWENCDKWFERTRQRDCTIAL